MSGIVPSTVLSGIVYTFPLYSLSLIVDVYGYSGKVYAYLHLSKTYVYIAYTPDFKELKNDVYCVPGLYPQCTRIRIYHTWNILVTF
jgi:hypothetical protein